MRHFWVISKEGFLAMTLFMLQVQLHAHNQQILKSWVQHNCVQGNFNAYAEFFI